MRCGLYVHFCGFLFSAEERCAKSKTPFAAQEPALYSAAHKPTDAALKLTSGRTSTNGLGEASPDGGNDLQWMSFTRKQASENGYGSRADVVTPHAIYGLSEDLSL